MSSLAILILTKNEEDNIVDVVENAKQCTPEVLVIDSGSTDKTVELAQAHGAKVCFRAWTDDFAAQRNFALEQTTADWVLYLDADERLNAELIEAVKRAVADGVQKQYSFQRKSVAFADTLDYDYVGLHESSAIHAFLRQHSDLLHRPIKQRIQVGNFEAACRMIEAGVGIGILPESAARRHAKIMDIRIIQLSDEWSNREMQIVVRNLESLPSFARELVELLVEDGTAADDADGADSDIPISN